MLVKIPTASGQKISGAITRAGRPLPRDIARDLAWLPVNTFVGMPEKISSPANTVN